MGKTIVLDAELKAKLNGLNETVPVCEPDGTTVGQFVPQGEYLRLLYRWANDQVTDEELDRASREPGGLPLAEVWKRLGRS